MQEIAIDLGTANTIIYYNDKVVVDEPSIVAKDRTTQKTVAIGRKAQQSAWAKTHENIKTIRPLKDGVIADFQSAEDMIKGMIKMINKGKSWFAPSLRMVIVSLLELQKLRNVLLKTALNMPERRKFTSFTNQWLRQLELGLT